MLLYGILADLWFHGFDHEFSTAIAQVTLSIWEVGLGAPGIGLIFGIVFLISGLAFKVSAVPFHMWTPDVYEGAPTPVTAFFATAAEGGGAVALFTARHPDAVPL